MLCVVVYAGFGLFRVRLFILNGYDLGIFDQIVRHYAHFQVPYVTLKGDDYNIFADHFHPIVATWGVLYWVWADVRMLIIGQAVVVAAAVFPLKRFVTRHLPMPFAKTFVALAMLGWPIVSLVNFDVHEIAFGVLLLAWILDSLDRRAVIPLLISCLLLLFVREDMGAIVATAGVVWVLSPWRRRRHWRDWALSAGLVIGGLAAFVLITGVVIPHFDAGGYAYWDYGAFGSGAGPALVGMVTQPWKVLWLMFWPPVKTLTWLALLLPLGLLPCRSPYFLMVLPIMLERMLAGRENLWGLSFHYNAPVWIILVFAAVHGFGGLGAGWRSRLAARRRLITGVAWAIIVGVAATLLVTEAISDSDGADRRAGAAQIPANTCVVAGNRLAAGFVATNRVTVPGVSDHRQDFYILDMKTPPTASPLNWTAAQTYDKAIADGFQLVFVQGTVVVLRAGDYQGPDAAQCGPFAR